MYPLIISVIFNIDTFSDGISAKEPPYKNQNYCDVQSNVSMNTGSFQECEECKSSLLHYLLSLCHAVYRLLLAMRGGEHQMV